MTWFRTRPVFSLACGMVLGPVYWWAGAPWWSGLVVAAYFYLLLGFLDALDSGSWEWL